MPTSSTTKLSISSPHRTTDEYDGSSSILFSSSVPSLQFASDIRLASKVTHLYSFRTYRCCQLIEQWI